jgi:hypothetical protein
MPRRKRKKFSIKTERLSTYFAIILGSVLQGGRSRKGEFIEPSSRIFDTGPS